MIELCRLSNLFFMPSNFLNSRQIFKKTVELNSTTITNKRHKITKLKINKIELSLINLKLPKSENEEIKAIEIKPLSLSTITEATTFALWEAWSNKFIVRAISPPAEEGRNRLKKIPTEKEIATFLKGILSPEARINEYQRKIKRKFIKKVKANTKNK